MKREPLTIIGSISAAIGAFIVMMQTFGIPITDAQLDAIQNFVIVAGPLAIMLIGRQFVFSPETTEKLTDEAYQAGTPPAQPKPDIPEPPAQ